MSPAYRTLRERFRFEPDKIRGSRHIATVAPIRDEQAARAVIAEARAEFHTARHHAFAWRLGEDGSTLRASDDGEPAGSAGKPILQALETRELTFAVVVVSRIFGGTKLGFGGLVRAYGGAAAEALDRAEIIEVIPSVMLRISVDFADLGTVESLLANEGLTADDRSFDDKAHFLIELPLAQEQAFRITLRDHTQGRAQVLTPAPS